MELAWRASQGCAHARLFINKFNEETTNQITARKKNDLRILTGLITGHCKLNKHLNRTGLRSDPDCELCGRSNETAQHILCECVALKQERNKHFNEDLIAPIEIWKLKPHKIIEFYNECGTNNPHINNAF